MDVTRSASKVMFSASQNQGCTGKSPVLLNFATMKSELTPSQVIMDKSKRAASLIESRHDEAKAICQSNLVVNKIWALAFVD